MPLFHQLGHPLLSSSPSCKILTLQRPPWKRHHGETPPEISVTKTELHQSSGVANSCVVQYLLCWSWVVQLPSPVDNMSGQLWTNESVLLHLQKKGILTSDDSSKISVSIKIWSPLPDGHSKNPTSEQNLVLRAWFRWLHASQWNPSYTSLAWSEGTALPNWGVLTSECWLGWGLHQTQSSLFS